MARDMKSWYYQPNPIVLEFRLQLAQSTISGHRFPVSTPPDFVGGYTLPQESTFHFSHIQTELLSFEIFATIDKDTKKKSFTVNRTFPKGGGLVVSRKLLIIFFSKQMPTRLQADRLT